MNNELLRNLPGVDTLLQELKKDSSFDLASSSLKTRVARELIARLRKELVQGKKDLAYGFEAIVLMLKDDLKKALSPNLKTLINATGVIVHTNFGRSLLAEEAVKHLLSVASSYSNLEFDLKKGKRGLRYDTVSSLLVEITGAEAAIVVNNNAAAVLLCLDTLAASREVIVSRGELVEIGGSFRIPDVMAKSGAILKEVGTTNRTHLKDYEKAIGENTGLFLKVHTSNFQIRGFTSSVSISELSSLARKYDIPLMDDLGSGTFVDFSTFGLIREPLVQDSLKAGADIVCFSGDKLLGGPQAGIIVGKKEFVEAIAANPLTRALRIDKLTLAALEGTLRVYRKAHRDLIEEIPTLRMLSLSENTCLVRAEYLRGELLKLGLEGFDFGVKKSIARAGGGALPACDIASYCVWVSSRNFSAASMEATLRASDHPLLGRVEDGLFIMDVRTIQEGEVKLISSIFSEKFKEQTQIS